MAKPSKIDKPLKSSASSAQPAQTIQYDDEQPPPPGAITAIAPTNLSQSPRSTRLKRGRYWLVLFGGLALLIILSFSVWLIWWRHANRSGEALLKTAEANISRHYILPNDETPALATVTDVSKLSSPLFKRAKAGDQVLIYQKNTVAIVYRPSIDRIVSVGPVQIDTPQGGSNPN